MMIAERQWCDLTFYCPKCPLVIASLLPNQKYITSLDGALDSIIETRDYALNLLKGINA